MKEKYLAMLNTVYENGNVAEIIAAGFVTDAEEGELWFCNNKPEDGTQVDYVLFELKRIRESYVEIYPFDELSDEGKEKAVAGLWEINIWHDWWESTFEDAAQVKLKLTEFELDRGHKCHGEFIEYAKDTAEKIVENHGETCKTYQTAENYAKECASLWQVLPEKLDDDGYDENEAIRENEQEELDAEFLKSILEDYRIILQEEYEYRAGEESIIEAIEANEYKFTEDGKLA